MELDVKQEGKGCHVQILGLCQRLRKISGAYTFVLTFFDLFPQQVHLVLSGLSSRPGEKRQREVQGQVAQHEHKR